MSKPKKKAAGKVSKARRDITKKAAYAIPAVLTLAVMPSFAAAASGTKRRPKPKK